MTELKLPSFFIATDRIPISVMSCEETDFQLL